MEKTLVFDMDGTIADLYGVEGWLDMLRGEDATPYAIANPLYDMEMLNAILDIFKGMGWRIVVTTWLAMDASTEYDHKVRNAKIEWLDKMGFEYDEIHLVKYGTTKANCTRRHGGYQVLVDDNEKIRKGWTLGDTIDPTEHLFEKLLDLLVQVKEKEREVKNMYIAIIIFTILSIFGESYIDERNNKRIDINLFAVIDLILIIIYF